MRTVRWTVVLLAALVAWPLAFAITFTDDFTRSNGSLGADYSDGYSFGSTVGLSVASNQVKTTSGVAGVDLSTYATTLGADQYAHVSIVEDGSNTVADLLDLVLRAPAPTTFNGYRALNYSSTSVLQILRQDAGTGVDLSCAVAGDVAPGETLTFFARGSRLTLFDNKVFALGCVDTTYSGSGRAGLLAYQDASSVVAPIGDNFQAGEVPITYVGAGTEGEAASGNVTPGMPASLKIHDLVLCAIHSSDQVSHGAPSGWTQVAQGNGGGSTSRISLWKHRYVTSDPSTTFTHSSGSGIIAGCIALRAAKGGTYVDVDLNSSISTGTDATIETSTITPTQDFGVHLTVVGAADDNALTAITGYLPLLEDSSGGTQNNFIGTSGTPDEMVGIYLRDSMAGATGTITITQAAADAWAGFQISLKVVPLITPGLINLRQ